MIEFGLIANVLPRENGFFGGKKLGKKLIFSPFQRKIFKNYLGLFLPIAFFPLSFSNYIVYTYNR